MGYQRIVGELKGLSMAVSATRVRTRRDGQARASGAGGGKTGASFLQAHRESSSPPTSFTMDTIWPERLYMLFFKN